MHSCFIDIILVTYYAGTFGLTNDEVEDKSPISPEVCL